MEIKVIGFKKPNSESELSKIVDREAKSVRTEVCTEYKNRKKIFTN